MRRETDFQGISIGSHHREGLLQRHRGGRRRVARIQCQLAIGRDTLGQAEGQNALNAGKDVHRLRLEDASVLRPQVELRAVAETGTIDVDRRTPTDSHRIQRAAQQGEMRFIERGREAALFARLGQDVVGPARLCLEIEKGLTGSREQASDAQGVPGIAALGHRHPDSPFIQAETIRPIFRRRKAVVELFIGRGQSGRHVAAVTKLRRGQGELRPRGGDVVRMADFVHAVARVRIHKDVIVPGKESIIQDLELGAVGLALFHHLPLVGHATQDNGLRGIPLFLRAEVDRIHPVAGNLAIPHIADAVGNGRSPAQQGGAALNQLGHRQVRGGHIDIIRIAAIHRIADKARHGCIQMNGVGPLGTRRLEIHAAPGGAILKAALEHLLHRQFLPIGTADTHGRGVQAIILQPLVKVELEVVELVRHRGVAAHEQDLRGNVLGHIVEQAVGQVLRCLETFTADVLQVLIHTQVIASLRHSFKVKGHLLAIKLEAGKGDLIPRVVQQVDTR